MNKLLMEDTNEIMSSIEENGVSSSMKTRPIRSNSTKGVELIQMRLKGKS